MENDIPVSTRMTMMKLMAITGLPATTRQLRERQYDTKDTRHAITYPGVAGSDNGATV